MKRVNFVFVNGGKSVVNVAQPKRYRLSASCKSAFLNVFHHNFCDSNRNRRSQGSLLDPDILWAHRDILLRDELKECLQLFAT